MGIEAFPEIENFQKLPRQVIVKGGTSSFDQKDGAQLRGIVINNAGHDIKEVRVHMVIFNSHKIPILSTSTHIEPETLAQGGIGNFIFQLKDHRQEIEDYHLFTSWKFDDHA